MKQIQKISLKKGLDIPVSGKARTDQPEQRLPQTIALLGDDYVGMKPTMKVREGDKVACGQVLFVDKKNIGVQFTSPICGNVTAINRGEKRKFESIVIEQDGDDNIEFIAQDQLNEKKSPEDIRTLLVESGLWTAFRTRPFGKIPSIESSPHSLFITAIDTRPLALQPQHIIDKRAEDYAKGLEILRSLVDCQIHYCCNPRPLLDCEKRDDIQYTSFEGPHPAGLASTHIHYLDPVHENKFVWHIDYQDVADIGYLFLHGYLQSYRFVAVGGPACTTPQLIKTYIGANLLELCENDLNCSDVRHISGSVLCGQICDQKTAFLTRYSSQISLLPDNDGRSFFNWACPGTSRFSALPIFISRLLQPSFFSMNTALWGGKRAVYPIASYDNVMPLDILPTQLLKNICNGATENSKDLGCLELIEEDLALCSFVCAGKNDFGPELRKILTAIEQGN